MAVSCRACRNLVWRSSLLAAAAATLAGCGHAPRRASPPAYAARYPAEPYPRLEQPKVVALDAALGPLAAAPQPRTKPVHVLAVSGGGADTAFMAGALVGWTDAGTRPTFDVVTGVSGGALAGAFAFLGPKYDPQLRRLFTTLSTADLLRVRPVRYLLRDGAIASPEPLERLLEAEVNESFLADLRDAHARGRRLFVGTTNFATKRQVVWDLGAIASGDRPEAAALVRKVLLASVTWAGVTPPVEFQVDVDGRPCREQHIDGGATAQVFVRFGPTPGWPTPGEPAPGWLAGSNLYVLAGGKLYATPAPAPDGFFGRVLAAVSSLTGSLARADLSRLHALCLSSGMRFHLLALPQDYAGTRPSLLQLDPAEMRRLFEAGYQLAAAGPAWRRTPPGAEPGEEEVPRGAPAGCSFR